MHAFLQVLALLPFFAQATSPIHTLVSAYTRGEQLSMELGPAATGVLPAEAYVAEGATIVRVDLTASPLAELPGAESVPDCQPLAMRYFKDTMLNSQGQPVDYPYLFIAGGALGVWRLRVPPSTSELVQFQAPIEGPYFTRKRCVDVAIVDH